MTSLETRMRIAAAAVASVAERPPYERRRAARPRYQSHKLSGRRRPVQANVPVELIERIDELRGAVSRSAWIAALLERAVEEAA